MENRDYYIFFEKSPSPMWIFEIATGKFLDVNMAAIMHYGFSRSEFLTMTADRITFMGNTPQANNITEDIKCAVRHFKNVFRHIKKDGQLIYVEVESNPIDFKGSQAMLVLVHDITQKIEHQKEILENIERYNIMSKATSDIIWDYNLNTLHVSWNKGLSGILKYKDSGKNKDINWWKNRIHPEDRTRVLNKLDKNFNEGRKRWEYEYRFLCGDGKYKYIRDRVYLGLDENGDASRMVGAMQDITGRMEEVHWSKLLESVVINTTDGVLITDAPFNSNLSIVYVNEALVKMSGYSREELIGSGPDIFYGIGEDREDLKKLFESIKNNQACNAEVTNYTKENQPYDVSVNISPVTNVAGEVTHWISIRRDITENRKYIKAIEEQNKRLTDIAWMHAHMIRAPLTRIMSLVELLEAGSSGDDTRDFLKYLAQSAFELDRVIIDITNNIGDSADDTAQ